jgi:hypothetical protein
LPSRRNTLGGNLVNLGDYQIPDKVRGDEMGVQTLMK